MKRAIGLLLLIVSMCAIAGGPPTEPLNGVGPYEYPDIPTNGPFTCHLTYPAHSSDYSTTLKDCEDNYLAYWVVADKGSCDPRGAHWTNRSVTFNTPNWDAFGDIYGWVGHNAPSGCNGVAVDSQGIIISHSEIGWFTSAPVASGCGSSPWATSLMDSSSFECYPSLASGQQDMTWDTTLGGFWPPVPVTNTNPQYFYGRSGSFTTVVPLATASDTTPYWEAVGTTESDGSTTLSAMVIKDALGNTLGTGTCASSDCTYSATSAVAGTGYSAYVTGTTTGSVPYHKFQMKSVPYTSWTSWTPTLSFGGSSTGITYSSQSGQYVQDPTTGLVYITELYLSLTSKGSASGTANISLPVPAAGGSISQCEGTSASGINHTGVGYLTSEVYSDGKLYVILNGDSGYIGNAASGDFVNNSWIVLSCTYPYQ